MVVYCYVYVDEFGVVIYYVVDVGDCVGDGCGIGIGGDFGVVVYVYCG